MARATSPAGRATALLGPHGALLLHDPDVAALSSAVPWWPAECLEAGRRFGRRGRGVCGRGGGTEPGRAPRGCQILHVARTLRIDRTGNQERPHLDVRAGQAGPATALRTEQKPQRWHGLARFGIVWHYRTMSEAAYLSAADAAARLGISLRTMRRRIADGSLPMVRIGRTVRIPAAALDLPSVPQVGAAAREAVASYTTAVQDDGRATEIARWNAAHWPDTFERMLARRRRALDVLDAIRAQSRPPTGSHDTVDAILEAVREGFGERLLDSLPPRHSAS